MTTTTYTKPTISIDISTELAAEYDAGYADGFQAGSAPAPDPIPDPVPDPTPAPNDPLAQPLMVETDVSYVGSFRNSSADMRAYATGASKTPGHMYTTYKPGGGGVRSICEQTIADIGATSVRTIEPVATVGDFGGDDQFPSVHGFYYHAPTDKIIYGHYSNYSNLQQQACVASMNPDFTGATAPQAVQDGARQVNQRVYSGFMGEIPAEWQELLGGDMFLGGTIKSIQSNNHGGFSLMAINGADVDGTGPVDGTTLMEHVEPTHPSNVIHRAFNFVLGGCFVPNTRTFLMWGREGTGTYEYGEVPPINDPCDQDKGMHAYPYNGCMWAFDIQDFVDVKNGVKERWEPYFYSIRAANAGPNDGVYMRKATDLTWKLPGLLGATDCMKAYMSANFYDPRTKRFYAGVSEYGARINTYVFELTT